MNPISEDFGESANNMGESCESVKDVSGLVSYDSGSTKHAGEPLND